MTDSTPTRLRRPLVHFFAVTALAATCLAPNSVSAATPEGSCNKGRHDAHARFVSCHQRGFAKVHNDGTLLGIDAILGKCRAKYFAIWAKLQAKASGTGSTCDSPRFVDNGDGTTSDVLTGLQWEQKATDLGVRDVGQIYRLNQSGVNPTPNGTAYTTFMAAVNGACFAGPCDWRVPTFMELQTILQQPCAGSPCIDAAFGPTDGSRYWGSTPNPADLESGYVLHFGTGALDQRPRAEDHRVRAVRGGL